MAPVVMLSGPMAPVVMLSGPMAPVVTLSGLMVLAPVAPLPSRRLSTRFGPDGARLSGR